MMRENAHRLASALWRNSGDPDVIKKLAEILNYTPGQLQQDMVDISEYIDVLEAEQDPDQ